MSEPIKPATVPSVDDVVRRLRERAAWLESRSFAELHGTIEREAADRLEQLDAKLRQAHKDYGCEIRDPYGTIWEYCNSIRSKAIDVLEWYHRDGSVGGACEPMDELRVAVGVTEEWLCRK